MQDWSESLDVDEMLRSLPGGVFQTELRLFSIACASRVLRFLHEPAFEQALLASKQFARGEVSAAELQRFVDAASSLLTPDVATPKVRDFAGSAVIDAASVHPATSKKVIQLRARRPLLLLPALAKLLPAPPVSWSRMMNDHAFDDAIQAETIAQCELLRSLIPDPNV